MQASLTVVGTGVKFLAQMTFEAYSYIKKSDKVLYLVNTAAMKQWIKLNNPVSESLDNLYFSNPLRSNAYTHITNYIIDNLSKPQHLCVALYGHPTVFAKPALDAVIKAKSLGYDAKILPGISAEACLFADLLIDPGTVGWQSFETTDFILFDRKFDPNSHLILWQPDVIGSKSHTKINQKQNINILSEILLNIYPRNHIVIIYEAAQYPGMKPILNKIELINLKDQHLADFCTLYIPPLGNAQIKTDRALKLGLNINKC